MQRYMLIHLVTQKMPDLPPAKTPLQAIRNGLAFYKELQQPVGNWACEYGGPLFLTPGLVITWYVTETPIPWHHRNELIRYLFARANEDGGWGLHIEGESSVFGTSMNYTTLRLLGVDAEDERMRKARATLWKMGGALKGPHWAKFWLAVLGVLDWDVVNPVPPELWYVVARLHWDFEKRMLTSQVAARLGTYSSVEVVGSHADRLPPHGLCLLPAVVVPP